LSLSRAHQSVIDSWIKNAAPLAGQYFRSVEYRFMDPAEVLSGAGAKKYGGRFAPVGTRAVYLSESDAGASGEVLARKLRLGGQAQISLEKYPRIVFAVAVSLTVLLSIFAHGLSATRGIALYAQRIAQLPPTAPEHLEIRA